jgi:hypothetical protein
MAAANASAGGQRAAILASPLHELTGFYLAVDCLTPNCRGERTFAVAEMASGRVRAAWLVTGPILRTRVRSRRVALRGPDARE